MKQDPVYERLISCGIHPSLQRVAIMRYLMEHPSHPTVDEVYRSLCPTIATLSRTTVYNTLRLFSERNAARMITIDDHRVCYDGDTHPHVHFFCKRCGRVYDLPAEPAPSNETKMVGGNRVEDIQLYYRGVCAHCLQEEAAAN